MPTTAEVAEPAPAEPAPAEPTAAEPAPAEVTPTAEPAVAAAPAEAAKAAKGARTAKAAAPTKAARAAKADAPARAAKADAPAKAAKADAPAKADAAAEADLPVAGYDQLSVASLRARLRVLDVAQVRTCSATRRHTRNAANMVPMFERRIAKLGAGRLIRFPATRTWRRPHGAGHLRRLAGPGPDRPPADRRLDHPARPVWVEGQIAELTRRGGTVFLTLRDPLAAVSVRVICPRTVLDATDPPPG